MSCLPKGKKVLFHKKRLRQNASLGLTHQESPSFLQEHVDQAFLSRLECFPTPFNRILVSGSVRPLFIKRLQDLYPKAALILLCGAPPQGAISCQGDEEALPFSPGAFDLVLSSLTFHFANDPQHVLQEIKRVLTPNGLFLSSFLGGETLLEVRTLLLEEEVRITGGAHQRVAPMIPPTAAAALLQHAGFKEPVTETETLTASFKSLRHLRFSLKQCGAQAPFSSTSPSLPRSLVKNVEKRFLCRYPSSNQRLNLTFELLSYTGWRS